MISVRSEIVHASRVKEAIIVTRKRSKLFLDNSWNPIADEFELGRSKDIFLQW